MSNDVSLYDDAGRITCVATLSDSTFAHYVESGQRMVVGERADTATHHVLDGAIVQRPTNPATLAGLHLANLPAPCAIAINGTDYPCMDATADLAFTYPGAYKVIVRAFPYLDATFDVTT
ncbi:hypothetical protein AAKU55_003924 [Oxalobacteraceae bacterium GrIS 1.11]